MNYNILNKIKIKTELNIIKNLKTKFWEFISY